LFQPTTYSAENRTLKISVIIPALNEAESIQRSIETSLALSPHEIIVADGGSIDDTVTIAQKLDCRVMESPRGRASQQNTGAAAATGDVLLFLHADSWLVPEARQQIENILASPKIPGGAFYHRIDSDGLLFRLVETGDALRVCSTRIAYGDQGIFLRREVFEALGGFPDVRLMEDVRLMKSLRDFGRLAMLPGPLHVSARRWQKHGAIRQTIRNWCLRAAEHLGVHPDRLADLYVPHRNPVTPPPE
jgi:rSAM/selenodomain-associated transferase 2